MPRRRHVLLLLLLLTPLLLLPCWALTADERPAQQQKQPPPPPPRRPDAADWATYNYDVLGTRHNRAEKSLSKDNVGGLVEKWRYPSRFALLPIGAVHATPVVVNGHVYFGTATLPAFYKLTPDGKLKWKYTNPGAPKARDAKPEAAFGVPSSGFANAALVTEDTVYVGDIGGTIYALARSDGKERWKINTRAAPFPGAIKTNCIFSAPVLADGNVIIAGGAFEHMAATDTKQPCCRGRGFVVALEPRTGKVVWKYDVGPEPKKLVPPVKITDDFGEHVFHYGPSTSSVWATPSYDAASRLVFFGTDTHNAPRQPTKDDPKLYTKHSCAVIAVDARTGKEAWVTQLNPGDVWNYAMRAYDPKTGLYKDQSIGDTPKPYTVRVGGKDRRVVGVGCKNGVFYVLDLLTGKLIASTPQYKGPPAVPPSPAPHPRTLALPGPIGGLQTGCATDGRAVYTNGIDSPLMLTRADPKVRMHPPTGGRVVSISLDTAEENWRHERPKVAAVGGSKARPAFTNVGDPVGSGIALANGVAYFTTTVSNKLVALDAGTGKVIREVALEPVWCGPSVSRGRVYVGVGNILFSPFDPKEAYFPKQFTGAVYSYGLPGKDDEVTKLGAGDE